MYKRYTDLVHRVVTSGDISTFKSEPAYREILEHCSPQFGRVYYDLLRTTYGLSDDTISTFCTMNDQIGSPVRHSIGNLKTPVSPASLLYLYHAMITLDHLVSRAMNRHDIVEVGCGYGGLILALDYASKLRSIPIHSYACVDLDAPLRLQSLYLSSFDISFPITFHSATTYGGTVPGRSLFLVSIYCFSEIEREHQRGYIRTLFPNVSHGLLLWNHVPLFDFGKPILLAEPEVPCTGPGNLLVLF